MPFPTKVQLIQRQASQQGVKFSGGDCPMIVRSDPNLLGEIMQNLVSNAIRYTDRGGEVSVRCVPAGARLRVDVVDTGIGIDSSELENIFREFHQVKSQSSDVEGFGLGLAIVRRLATSTMLKRKRWPRRRRLAMRTSAAGCC